MSYRIFIDTPETLGLSCGHRWDAPRVPTPGIPVVGVEVVPGRVVVNATGSLKYAASRKAKRKHRSRSGVTKGQT